jgi:hypothetical protein
MAVKDGIMALPWLILTMMGCSIFIFVKVALKTLTMKEGICYM